MVDVDEKSVKDFLSECAESGDKAYEKFKEILRALDNEATRGQTRRFLTALEKASSPKHVEDSLKAFHFRIHRFTLSGEASSHNRASFLRSSKPNTTSITLLEMASIFIPEQWSFTFFEGLTRQQDAEMAGKDVAELGCGNGWITIALAQRYLPRKIYGVDLNPRAIKVARINLYLNALDESSGNYVRDAEGKGLLDRVEFHESDLLGYMMKNGIVLDKIVGCIPQILSPDPEATLRIVCETMSEEHLYHFSNYCGLQGLVEDQFGLGLIARAVEESIEVLKPHGTLVFNMGGRPGQAVCERLFERRGFQIEQLWQTKVIQAADTDILALVEIEKNSRHRFEFYMGLVSDETISARTAYAYAKAGGEIAHGLSVYACRLQHPNYVRTIFRFLNQPGFGDTRSALDLSFSSPAVADEKIHFLSYLSQALLSSATPSSHPPSGLIPFRQKIAQFLRVYFRIPYSHQHVLIAPTRASLIENILRSFSPSLALVDASLTRSLPKEWLSDLPYEERETEAGKRIVVLQSPRRVDLVAKLARALKPKTLILTLPEFDMQSSSAFSQLLSVCKEVGARLFLDVSDSFELSSRPAGNGVFQYLAENPLPMFAGVICGLVKNEVYSDLESSFLLSENASLLSVLSHFADVTYHRPPVLSQLYYECLLDELLRFQIPGRYCTDMRPVKYEPPSYLSFVPLAPRIAKIFGQPSLQFHDEIMQDQELRGTGDEVEEPEEELNQNGKEERGKETTDKAEKQEEKEEKDRGIRVADEGEGKRGGEKKGQRGGEDGRMNPIHMDRELQFTPPPLFVKQFLFESFARQNVAEGEKDPAPEILEHLSLRFSLSLSKPSRVVLGDGSCALFSQLMRLCGEEKGTLLYPSGSFGTFVSAAKCFSVNSEPIETKIENNFKLTTEGLSSALARLAGSPPVDGVKNPEMSTWLLLSAPVVNPTGAVYTSHELSEILEKCKQYGVRVILDACFAALQFPNDGETSEISSVEKIDLESLAFGDRPVPLIILGELSAQLSTAGFLFGYAAFRDPRFLEAFANHTPPHGTLRYSVKKICNALNQDSDTLRKDLFHWRSTFKTRATALAKTLSEAGWDVVQPSGGYFLVAKPTFYFGKSVQFPIYRVPGKFEKVLLKDANAISKAMYRATGLLVNNSDWTGLSEHVRFAFLLDDKEFDKGLNAVVKFQKFVIGA